MKVVCIGIIGMIGAWASSYDSRYDHRYGNDSYNRDLRGYDGRNHYRTPAPPPKSEIEILKDVEPRIETVWGDVCQKVLHRLDDEPSLSKCVASVITELRELQRSPGNDPYLYQRIWEGLDTRSQSLLMNRLEKLLRDKGISLDRTVESILPKLFRKLYEHLPSEIHDLWEQKGIMIVLDQNEIFEAMKPRKDGVDGKKLDPNLFRLGLIQKWVRIEGGRRTCIDSMIRFLDDLLKRIPSGHFLNYEISDYKRELQTHEAVKEFYRQKIEESIQRGPHDIFSGRPDENVEERFKRDLRKVYIKKEKLPLKEEEISASPKEGIFKDLGLDKEKDNLKKAAQGAVHSLFQGLLGATGGASK